ncbi:MAG: sugar phosphate nucleotidyltransferase [Aigarchaeota archaeon]|nr:sugar phosphate nucleotidyltransferase [Aigarchaeota archaeon]MCX8193436.1 sugar phosphate nucleotidyltransferase [Nitrososphaeria archaeon]
MKAVVFAAGLGKRLRPLTSTRPKHLLPVAGKPMLRRVLESLLVNDIDEVGIVISYMHDIVIREVSSYGLDIKIEWIYQEEPRGTGHALHVCEDFLKDEEYFLISYGDITLNEKVVRELLSFFNRNECDGVIEGVYVEDTSRFGRIIFSNSRLEKIEEKSRSGPGIVNSGLYILPRKSIQVAYEVKPSQRGEYELTEVLNIMASRNYKILVHSYSNIDWWIDIGNPIDYLKANIRKFIEEFGEKIVCYSEIDSSIKIIPPSMILKDVTIGRDSIVGPNAFIMENVEIGSNSRIENSILLEGCRIRSNSIIRNMIIGEYAEVKERFSIEGGEPISIIAPYSVVSDEIDLKR